MRRSGTDCSVVLMKWRNGHGEKGAGHPAMGSIGQLATGRTDWSRPKVAAQPSFGGTSRMSREAHVRICERFGVQFPGRLGRGLAADHTTIWRWVQRYGPELQQRLRRHLKPTNKSWRVDETYVRIKGRWHYLYRAVDSAGATIDFLLSAGATRMRPNGCFAKLFEIRHIPSLASSIRIWHRSTPRQFLLLRRKELSLCGAGIGRCNTCTTSSSKTTERSNASEC